VSDPRDYKLDIHSLQLPEDTSRSQDSSGDRPFISVLFACCWVYIRIYRNPDGSGYRGACPRCGKRVKFAIGPGGTTVRSFMVS
jgi:hypothetical protein